MSPRNITRQRKSVKAASENGRAGIANHRRNQLDFVMDPVQFINVATHLIDAIRKAREVAARVKDAEVQAILT